MGQINPTRHDLPRLSINHPFHNRKKRFASSISQKKRNGYKCTIINLLLHEKNVMSSPNPVHYRSVTILDYSLSNHVVNKRNKLPTNVAFVVHLEGRFIIGDIHCILDMPLSRRENRPSECLRLGYS